MRYNLFLDDERLPYEQNLIDGFVIESAFDLTYDKRYKELDWIVVKDFGQFVDTIERMGIPQIISCDHDLQDSHYYHYQMYTIFTGKIDYTVVEGTGYECVKWLTNYLLDYNLDCPVILVHTQNTVGAENIWREIENFEKNRK